MKQLRHLPDLLLLTTTMIWGWSFIIVKWSITTIDPYLFIFIRFLLAFLLLGIIFHSKLKGNWRRCLAPGFFLGILLGLAFITQTLGLKYTTASASGFITGLNVIMVTIFAAIINRKLPKGPVLTGIVAATAGLFLITYKGSLVFARGDILTLICALLFAIHLVFTERLARDLPAGVLTLVQFLTVILLSGLGYCCFGTQPIQPASWGPLQWAALLYSGFLGTAMAFLFQTKAQQQIPAFRTAILLATEPLFAGIFAISLGFDPFDWKVIGGGLLILAGMVLASWDIKNT